MARIGSRRPYRLLTLDTPPTITRPVIRRPLPETVYLLGSLDGEFNSYNPITVDEYPPRTVMWIRIPQPIRIGLPCACISQTTKVAANRHPPPPFPLTRSTPPPNRISSTASGAREGDGTCSPGRRLPQRGTVIGQGNRETHIEISRVVDQERCW